jgi:hypothetical protein
VWFLLFSMFLIETYWYTLFYNVRFSPMCFSVWLTHLICSTVWFLSFSKFLIVTHWYTQFPFPTNVFFRVTHSSNMFYSVIFIIFHVSHCKSFMYTVRHCPFQPMCCPVLLTHLIYSTVWFLLFSMFLIVTHWYKQFYNARFQHMCFSV